VACGGKYRTSRDEQSTGAMHFAIGVDDARVAVNCHARRSGRMSDIEKVGRQAFGSCYPLFGRERDGVDGARTGIWLD